MEGSLEELNDENDAVNLTSSAQFYMSLKETTCLLMKVLAFIIAEF